MFAKTLKKKLLMQATVLAAPLFLAGCSSVPDAVNPVEWYRSTVEYFDSEDAEKANAPKAQESGETADVAEERMPSGFVAAKQPERQYAQPVMRQGEVVNALSDSKKVDVAQPPAPRAAPTQPVMTAKVAEPTTVSAPQKPKEMKMPEMGSRPMPASTQPQPVAELDKRSVSEVYADNLSQTRPLGLNTAMRGSDTLSYGDHAFETVVVSGSGVSRQNPGFGQNRQVASLSRNVMSDVSDTYTSAMMVEPRVVSEGKAVSMARFNPSMFAGSFQVATIQFGNGSSNLTGEDKRILREVLSIHQQQGGVIRIVGHASSRTRDMSPDQHQKVNMGVSLKRADMVARELLKLGMPGDRLYVGGVSDNQPLYQEVMPSGEAGNRRTEIFVDY
jgi:outer membrane protein OmpA-like peptidoglycan-associated protein